MKLPRLSHDPGALIEFFEEGLTTLGAVCERSWHDRLDLVAEGRAASLWNAAGDFVERQLHFVPTDATGRKMYNFCIQNVTMLRVMPGDCANPL